MISSVQSIFEAAAYDRDENLVCRGCFSNSLMTRVHPVLSHNQVEEPGHISSGRVLTVFAIIAAVSFVLRIAYAGHLYEDDGLWFTAGEEILRGKALYSQIYFDKPPGLALCYALLFWIFGPHILTVRLFTIAYSIAISVALYFFGSWFYNKRIGLLAAAMFAVFSTTLATGHAQSLSTDLLMALPYTLAVFLLIRSRWPHLRGEREGSRPAWLAMAGGALAGFSFQVNPKGLFDLIFFAIFLIASRNWLDRNNDSKRPGSPEPQAARSTPSGRSPFRLFSSATIGFALGTLPFFSYILATRSQREYWAYVWDWGLRYGSYYGAGKTVLSALIRSLDFFALDNTLLIALVFLVLATVRSWRKTTIRSETSNGLEQAPEASFEHRRAREADATLLIWFAVSYGGVMVGGRFFAHYFIQILPALCLVGARGLTGIHSSLRTRGLGVRRIAIAIISIGFAITIARFHGRSVLLMADLVRGTVSESNVNWYYGIRDREERMVAAQVRELPDGADAADVVALEAIRAGGPRLRTVGGPEDYVFVWGYRPEVYFWSGLIPASRYLSSQPLTGVPADVHYFDWDYHSLLNDEVTAQARLQVVRDLEETQPKYIVDEIGFFNGDLAILRYPELRELMGRYKAIGSTGRFLLYIRRDLTKKNLRRSVTQP